MLMWMWMWKIWMVCLFLKNKMVSKNLTWKRFKSLCMIGGFLIWIFFFLKKKLVKFQIIEAWMLLFYFFHEFWPSYMVFKFYSCHHQNKHFLHRVLSNLKHTSNQQEKQTSRRIKSQLIIIQILIKISKHSSESIITLLFGSKEGHLHI